MSFVQSVTSSCLLANSPIYFWLSWCYFISLLVSLHHEMPSGLTELANVWVMCECFPCAEGCFFFYVVPILYLCIFLVLQSFELCAGSWAIGLSLKGTSGQHQGQLGRNQTVGPHRLPICFPRGELCGWGIMSSEGFVLKPSSEC